MIEQYELLKSEAQNLQWQTEYNKLHSERIYEEIESIEKAEQSLYEFHKQAWDVLEPDPFIDGWYIQVIAEHVEALFNREIKNLILNIPPRTGKSTLISVTAPAWRFLHCPSERFAVASHSQGLAFDLSIKCRRLIQSEWYQRRWGHKFKIVGDQNTKGRFDNDKGGYRIATTVGSSFTGGGGTALFCLPYDTLISTDEGDKYIGEIYYDRSNAKVLTYNHEYERAEYKEIEAYMCNGEQELLEIQLDDRKIQCTEDHPIFVHGKGYIEAKYIQPGDVLYCL